MHILGQGSDIDSLINSNLYLKSYDPEGNDGFGDIEFTDSMQEAMPFNNSKSALELYIAVPENHPVRLTDQQPNRPLTAYSIEVIEIPES